MTNTVLILGGSGKVGRHSAIAFERAGWTVRRFDRQQDKVPQIHAKLFVTCPIGRVLRLRWPSSLPPELKEQLQRA